MHCTLLLLLTLAQGEAQNAAAPSTGENQRTPAYEVVSIHLAGSVLEFKGAMDEANGTHAVDSLKGLVSYAYGTRPEFVFCALKWCDSTVFDIHAKVGEESVAQLDKLTLAQRAAMLKAVLSDRFGVNIHREMRVVPVFDLLVAKGGSKLVDAPTSAELDSLRKSGRPPNGVIKFKKNEMTGYAVQIAAFTKTLSALFSDSLGRPVIDKTALTGNYDFHLKWASDLDAASAAANGSDEAQRQGEAGAGTSIFTAIQDQMGLRIVPAKESLEVIVVDSAHLPSEN